MDARQRKAQELYVEIQELERQQDHPALPAKFAALASLREERALSLLEARQEDGWLDLFTAVTAWGRAGEKAQANRLLAKGRRLAAGLGLGRGNVVAELRDLKTWLDQLPASSGRPADVPAAGSRSSPRIGDPGSDPILQDRR
jgi:hypothetical protein